ncbi:cysteine-rich RLK (RECEPTOR-like protein kinase) 26 [Artemisia annua]|uniref:Cysteine-rich RLK (RECEPTOR-like protein kinase) 26 n=1 Tax=Artemisia annua TaxID=35608 RepID=A0A2U1NEF4_ARTAN|nr:cysteine-rich RLK (RECEPTOR-like protein kinase) 26 [Artemisia annua]
MFILTGKQPFTFLFIFLYLVNTITLAQPLFNSYDCFNDAGNYTRNSTYERNLGTLLSSLPNINSGFGFFNSSTGQGSDTVHAVALCRGDVNLDACRSCIYDSIVNLREICPNKKQAIGYYNLCMLKYSNQTLLGNTDVKHYVLLEIKQTASDVDRFNGALSSLLNNLTAKASAGGSLGKFATGNTSGPGATSIYALVQCRPDLTQQQCNECLGAEPMDIGTAESLQYGFSVVKAATNDFADDNKLGRGGFGAVYKAWKTWRNDTLLDMIDTTLKTGPGSLRDTIRCIHIGLLCVQQNAIDRPTMASVVYMLNNYSLALPLPSEPAFFMNTNTGPEMPLFSNYTSSTGSSGPEKYSYQNR